MIKILQVYMDYPKNIQNQELIDQQDIHYQHANQLTGAQCRLLLLESALKCVSQILSARDKY